MAREKGYTLSHFSEGQAPTSSSHERVDEQDQQSKKEEKSVVDQWLEKNGYEIERQEPIVEEKVAQEMSAPQKFQRLNYFMKQLLSVWKMRSKKKM